MKKIHFLLLYIIVVIYPVLVNSQSITLQSPNGGETWTYGQNEIVTWTGTGLGSQISLEFSPNGGGVWSFFGNAPSGPNGGNCLVSVPNIPTQNALIRVSDAANSSVSDVSNAPFNVYVAPITIFAPNSQSAVYNGTSLYTNWAIMVPGITLLNAELSTDNGSTFTLIAQNLVAGAYYAYLPISVASPSDFCILRLSNAANPSQFGLSQPFVILPQPEYTVTYPSQGDFLNVLTSYTVTFTVENNFGQYCSAEYSTNGGLSWTYITSVYVQGSSGVFEWITPDVTSDDCLLRITDGIDPSVMDTSATFSIFPFPETPICMVTVDSLNGFNTVVWEKPITDLIEDFLVYRETDEANVYEVIDTVSYDSLSISQDPASNPAVRPYRYKLGFIDTLNRVFPLSDFHQTIHLTIGQGVGNAWNLIWNSYIGFDYSFYRILRSSEGGPYQQIATVSASFNSYTDFNAPPGIVAYLLEVESPEGCSPSSRESYYGSASSNVASNNIPVSVSELSASGFRVFPIPAKDAIHVAFEKDEIVPVVITISDLTGKILIKREHGTIYAGNPLVFSTSGITDGMYILHITRGESVSVQKILIRK